MKRPDSGTRGVSWRAHRNGSQKHPRTRERGDWWIQWFCSFGHRHREKVGPKSRADMAVHERRLERSCPAHEAAPARILLADAIRDYLRDHRYKRSQKDDARHGRFWTTRFGARALDEIASGEIRKVRAERLGQQRGLLLKDRPVKTLAAGTVNRELAFLRRIFTLAIEDGRVPIANPVRNLLLKEPSGRTRYLADEDEPRLMAVLEDWEARRVVFVCDTGLRKAEFLGLRWQDCDLKTSILTIPRSKSGLRRHVPLTSRARTILLGLPRPLDPAALVFPNGEGHRDLRWVEKRFPQAVAKAGLTDFRFHDLRHTFASRLVRAGVDLKSVKELGGWRSLVMVERYAHLSPEHLHRAIERLVERKPAASNATGNATAEGERRGGGS
jgi:integrase